jgi:hypothetical protein
MTITSPDDLAEAVAEIARLRGDISALICLPPDRSPNRSIRNDTIRFRTDRSTA